MYRYLLRGFLAQKTIWDIPSLMIEDDIVPRSEWSNARYHWWYMVRWYGGFDIYYSIIILTEYSLHSVSMGRKQEQEDETYRIFVPFRVERLINTLSQFHVEAFDAQQ